MNGRRAPVHLSTVAVLAAVALTGAGCRTATPAPDGPDRLTGAWSAYRSTYITAEGAVIDRTRQDGDVTSEGQAYALLRAAWLDDVETFTRVLAWTDRHLRRPDGLYSWLWTTRDGGRVVDRNSATDADQDIAFALVVAASRFDRPQYLARARDLVVAIRTQTAVRFPGGWLPSAGNWATTDRIVNLSYFAPSAYVYFDRLDPAGGWLDARRGGYALLERVGASGRRLPPDFMTVGADGAPGALPDGSRLAADFSWDGARIPWRLALDCRLFSTAGCEMPFPVPTLADTLRTSGRLVSRYDTRGQPLSTDQSPTFYACLLPWLRGDDAAAVRDGALGARQVAAAFAGRDRYYDANWVWFGLALADGLIAARTPPPATAIPGG